MKHHIRFLFVASFGLLTVPAFAQAQQQPREGAANAPSAVTENRNPAASAPAAVTKSPSQSAASVAAGGTPASDVRSEAIVLPPASERARLAVIDQNRDGRISVAEFSAATTQTAGQSVAPVIRQYDVDNDSFLSAAELERIPTSLWKR
jgi:hypothetical protein